MADRVKLQLPDWRKWATKVARHAAKDPQDYDLHIAAAEWALTSALDINRREDFLSLPSPGVEPFAHQVDDAILFFRRLAPRGLVADDVGLGKTITAGLVARELLERGRIESVLVVCPKSLMEQWQEELDSKFGIKAVSAVGAEFRELDRRPFWITSYDTARTRIDAIKNRKFDFLILDEAHALRNLFGTQKAPQRAVAFERLMRENAVRYCMMLTATPIQNRLWDIFSLLEIVKAPQPNPLGRPDEFRTQFIADAEARRLRNGVTEDFRARVADATIRTRRKDTRLLFPEREVRTERLKAMPDEQRFIDRALRMILRFPPLVQITHAMTLMSSPWAAAVAFENEAAKPNIADSFRRELLALSEAGRQIVTSAKVDAVVKLARASVDAEKSGRLIVFTRRIETVRHLEQALREAGFAGKIGVIQGNQVEANQRAIRDFMSEPVIRPILISTDTGAVGFNLQAGNIVVNYDLPWNPMVVEQRIGRVQRLGQKAKHVVVYNLVLAGSIEDHVVLRLMEKLNLFSQAIGEMEELLELCGYDENRSLEQIIMDLIRKAAEQKDIEDDLRKMEESRRDAEVKIREMREATEQALASIRPKDTGARLEGLRKITPRLGLRELVTACLKRAKADIRDDGDGRVFVRVPGGYEEFVFDRQARLVPGADGVRPVLPGTRAFEHVTKDIRDRVAHHVLDGRGVGLTRIERALDEILAPYGLVVDDVRPVQRDLALAMRLAIRAAVDVPSDRYETIFEVDDAAESDGVKGLLDAGESVSADNGDALGPVTDISTLGEAVGAAENRAVALARQDESINRFCAFYDERYKEDLERLSNMPALSDSE
jgi:superfamily II DNA or RNA helicase